MGRLGGYRDTGGERPPPHQHQHRRRRRGPAPRPPSIAPISSFAAPPHPATGTDVFVTARTDFRAQLRRCQRLLAPGGVGGSRGGPPLPPPAELRLHGLGLAVPRAINLALQLQAGAPGALRLHASTSSVTLPPLATPRRRRGPPRGEGGEGLAGEEDEEEEEEEEEEGASPRPRHNSAIHIRVCREAPCA
ncbi:ribonuclease P protein subunit p20 [Grus americana]|uniref:ribonuclease P protein subunit p20 n=1 Tax=Grus americana TaxID=9117 RepID=UPI002407B71A|nr:ribonuclease P protein subunit p20 [Grus americana]